MPKSSDGDDRKKWEMTDGQHTQRTFLSETVQTTDTENFLSVSRFLATFHKKCVECVECVEFDV